MPLCEALNLDGLPCRNKGCIYTDENIFVCKSHKTFTLLKKEQILQRVEENIFKKDYKEFIEFLNLEIMEGHEYDIPLRNKFGLIVDFAYVDIEDYEECMKFSWCKTADGYAVSSKNCRMQHFIFGKPDEDMVIDHKDNNRLNNRRSNLRMVTGAENTQNRSKIIRENTTSKYIGVSFEKRKNKWYVKYSRKHLGSFGTEIEAAKRYDTYVLLKFGPDAKTNDLVKLEEITITLDDFEFEKEERSLPTNIRFINGFYSTSITYKKQEFYILCKTLEEATKKLEEFKKQINDIKQKEIDDHYSQEIVRNKEGIAIIEIKNRKDNIIEEVLVDDNIWYELKKNTWTKSGKYYEAVIDKQRYHMHRYLMKAQKGDIVDHINGNKKDNRVSNLRITTHSVNNHNKKGYGSSKFRGVTYSKRENKWQGAVIKDTIYYSCGSYDLEIQAVIAVNIKTNELYGENAHLHDISEEDLKQNLQLVEDKLKFLDELKQKKKIQTSKYKGVRMKYNDRWQSRIKFNEKEIYIGTFDTEKEAALAYNIKCKELYGDSAKNKLNIIE